MKNDYCCVANTQLWISLRTARCLSHHMILLSTYTLFIYVQLCDTCLCLPPSKHSEFKQVRAKPFFPPLGPRLSYPYSLQCVHTWMTNLSAHRSTMSTWEDGEKKEWQLLTAQVQLFRNGSFKKMRWENLQSVIIPTVYSRYIYIHICFQWLSRQCSSQVASLKQPWY